MKVGDLVKYYATDRLGIVVKVSDFRESYKRHIVYVWFGPDQVIGQFSKHSLTVM
mgnify:CR=1 FL=1